MPEALRQQNPRWGINKSLLTLCTCDCVGRKFCSVSAPASAICMVLAVQMCTGDQEAATRDRLCESWRKEGWSEERITKALQVVPPAVGTLCLSALVPELFIAASRERTCDVWSWGCQSQLDAYFSLCFCCVLFPHNQQVPFLSADMSTRHLDSTSASYQLWSLYIVCSSFFMEQQLGWQA